jgi:histidyl-tRNA synthetase
MFKKIELTDTQIKAIFEFIEYWENNTNEEILSHFSQVNNKLLKKGINEIKEVYNWLLDAWIWKKYLKINPSISRWLNYYTWIVFETFIVWAENLWSIASGGRYENLASNFSKNNYPGVWGSIWLTRLLTVLESLWKLKFERKTISKVLVLNMWKKTLKNNLRIVEDLRKAWINTEIYLEEAKIQKQLKYANNKKIKYAVIYWDEELEKKTIQLKNLDTWEQEEVKEEEVIRKIKVISG